jgi:hypothetical protein
MKELVEVEWEVISQGQSGYPAVWGRFKTKEAAQARYPEGEHDGYGGLYEHRKVLAPEKEEE